MDIFHLCIVVSARQITLMLKSASATVMMTTTHRLDNKRRAWRAASAVCVWFLGSARWKWISCAQRLIQFAFRSKCRISHQNVVGSRRRTFTERMQSVISWMCAFVVIKLKPERGIEWECVHEKLSTVEHTHNANDTTTTSTASLNVRRKFAERT